MSREPGSWVFDDPRSAEVHDAAEASGHEEDLGEDTDSGILRGYRPDDPRDPGDQFDQGDEGDEGDSGFSGSQRTRRGGCGLPGCLAVLVALALLVGGAWFVLDRGIEGLKDRLAGPEDYPGPGTGQVLVEVRQGDTGEAIGEVLVTQGVVKSVGAFTKAYTANEQATTSGIQAGFYRLKKQMKASDAVTYLVDPDHLAQSVVTIPEGFRVAQIIDRVVAQTKISRASMRKALADGSGIGLPAAAEGNAEGYLFPATYPVTPKETAVSLLTQMVEKTTSELDRLDVKTKAAGLGLSAEQAMTMASILEYEGSRPADLPKIARVFYNRLADDMPLQSDATVAYASGVTGTVWTTEAQRANPSLYNTYQHTGLPPGPIGSPGETALQAALNPAKGSWLFFMPINLDTGETRFADTYAEHQRNVALLREWCAKTDSPKCD